MEAVKAYTCKIMQLSHKYPHRRNRDNSGIVVRKVGIITLSADSRIAPDNSRIAQGIHVVLWSDMVSAQSRNRRGQSKNLKGRIR